MKNHLKFMQLLIILVAAVFVLTGCSKKGKQEAEEKANEDVQYATDLWEQIKDYNNWTQPEGFKGWQEGKSPHGSVLQYYINDTAVEDLTADGAVIVKENYSKESKDAIMSVTVMEKREGYDPETKDWFYVKYSPKGEVMKNPAGKDLAGLIGKGGTKGCVPCHSAADGNDYLFMND